MPGDDNQLRAVACASGTCWAVGNHWGSADQMGHALIERNAGSGWQQVAAPASGPGDVLEAITCISIQSCWAVGSHVVSSRSFTLIEHYDGMAWRIVSSPNTGLGINDEWTGVTCPAPDMCWAVGYYNATQGGTRTLIAQYSVGSWRLVSRPPIPDPSDSEELLSVACRSASDCWAVGHLALAAQHGLTRPLVLHSAGGSWSVASAPATAAEDYDTLYSVACVANSECWAVGDDFSYDSSTGLRRRRTLIERNIADSWSVVSTPNAPNQEDELTGVACASASQCWAVGGAYAGNVGGTLIEYWNGTAWSLAASQNEGYMPELQSVACEHAGSCAAVGWYGTVPQNLRQTLVEAYAP